jgi:putative ABC transport system permease protein
MTSVLDALRELRYTLRGLRRSPGFSVTVIVTLALGIGANTAMFSIVDRLMFRPLTYLRDPATAHRIYWQWRERDATRTIMSTQYARYLDLQRWTTSFSQMAAFSERPLAIGEGEAAREYRVGTVSASFFNFFDARPALGRFFRADEDVTPRGADVVVLSHAFWQAAFGGRDVRGELLQVGNVRAEIIGVAPRDFAGVDDSNPPVAYIPITTFAGSTGTGDAQTYFSRYQWGWVHVMVRRKPGVTVEQAAADASQAFRRSWQAARIDEPNTPELESAKPQVVVSSIRPGAGPDPSLEARTALWLSIVAGIVLLIACANVANLFLVRGLQRRRETAVRLAIGVSRRRLIAQSLSEGAVLAFAGAAAAVLVSHWAGAAIRGLLLPASVTPLPPVADLRTLGVTAGIALLVAVVVGLVPALVSGRGDLTTTLRGGARGGTADVARLRSALLVVQGTLSVVLLIGATLFVRSLDTVKAIPMGYDAEHVLLVNRVLRGPWPGESAMREMSAVLLSTAQSLPSVEAAAWVSSAPFVSTSSTDLFVAGIDSVRRLGTFTYQATTPDYFRTMGTRVLRGRGFTTDDRFGTPQVAVVSASMARVLWPGREPLGQCFRVRADTMPCTTVVGIAEDMVQREIAGGTRYHFYMPIDQFRRTTGNGMVLRVRGNPALESEQIREALQRAMPGGSYLVAQPLQEIVQDARRSWWLGAALFLAFGVLAIVVAAVGLYGVIAHGVAQRKHEIGVRVALGARRAVILRLIVAHGFRLALASVVFGSLLSLYAGRWIEPLLFRQSTRDPGVYLGVAALMILVAAAASALPALRAASTDPVSALRAD